MYKKIIASLIGLSLSSLAIAAENIQLDEIVTTATRTPVPRESAIADVTVIDNETIQRSGQTTFTELLQQQHGVEMTQTGGAGQQAGILMRGTNTGHVIVLIDGMRVNSATAGITSVENLPLAQIDRIEIVRGPATSLYGQDGIGGVIQIFTKKGGGKPRFYANAGYGKYQTSKLEAGVQGSYNDTNYALNVGYQNVEGFSAYKTNNPNFNDDDGYRNRSLTANLSQKLAEGHEMGIQLFESDGQVEYDNRFNFTNFNSRNDLNLRTFALTSNNQFSQKWLSKIRVGLGQDRYKSKDEFSSNYKTDLTQINWQNDVKLSLGTLTLMYDRLEEEVTASDQFDETKRTNDGFVASFLGKHGAHNLHLSLREDHNSSFGNNFTGGLGYAFEIDQNWRISTSYGSAFKAPTFNDLYFPGFSNPNLAPEKSDNIEASLRFQNQASNFAITVFDNHIRDLIAFDLSTFTIENVNKARIKGLSLSGNHRWNNLYVSASTDFQSPKDDKTDNLLPRRANRNGKLNLNYDLQNWRFGAELVAASPRYNDLANTRKLAGYGLLNVTADYQINPDWRLQARLNNALDKDYALAYDGNFAYNTPGSNLFFNVRYAPQ